MSNEFLKADVAGKTGQRGRRKSVTKPSTSDSNEALPQKDREEHLNHLARRVSRDLLQEALQKMQDELGKNKKECIRLLAREYEKLLDSGRLRISHREEKIKEWLEKGITHGPCRHRIWEALDEIQPGKKIK